MKSNLIFSLAVLFKKTLNYYNYFLFVRARLKIFVLLIRGVGVSEFLFNQFDFSSFRLSCRWSAVCILGWIGGLWRFPETSLVLFGSSVDGWGKKLITRISPAICDKSLCWDFWVKVKKTLRKTFYREKKKKKIKKWK